MLYDYSQAREIYPYQKYNQFSLEIIDEAQYVTEFRFGKRDIPRLSGALQLPHKVVWCKGTVVSNIEALLTLSKRLSYSCRPSGMVPRSRRNPIEICLVFNYVPDYIYKI